MKISIVNPNISGDVSILDIGITYLATYINERTRHDASIIDFTFHRKNWKQHLYAQLAAKQPDVLGISATSLYMDYCRDIITAAKAIRPSLRIIMGGWHCSVDPEDSISNYPSVEAIVIGDGEYPLEQYLDRTANRESLEGVEGMWFKDGDGNVVKNERRPFIQNVDELPIPNYDSWDDLDKYMFYNSMLYFMGNRGCPFDCTYCSEGVIKKNVPGPNMRWRNPRELAREVRQQYEKYKTKGMRIAHFFDPVFPMKKSWVEEFTDEYRTIGMHTRLPFSCFTRIDTIDEERLVMLADAGCKILRIGIEAGSEHIRNEVYKKNINNNQYYPIFKLAHQHGIHITGFNMLGGPDETWETLQATFTLNKELQVDRPIFFIYRALPKTEGAEQVIAFGGEIDSLRHINSFHNPSNIISSKLNPRQIWLFKYRCIWHFSTRRVLRLIRKQKHRFFINLVRYIVHGLHDGVPPYFIIGYFLVCAGENLTE